MFKINLIENYKLKGELPGIFIDANKIEFILNRQENINSANYINTSTYKNSILFFINIYPLSNYKYSLEDPLIYKVEIDYDKFDEIESLVFNKLFLKNNIINEGCIFLKKKDIMIQTSEKRIREFINTFFKQAVEFSLIEE